jgi:hypothetical protein
MIVYTWPEPLFAQKNTRHGAFSLADRPMLWTRLKRETGSLAQNVVCFFPLSSSSRSYWTLEYPRISSSNAIESYFCYRLTRKVTDCCLASGLDAVQGLCFTSHMWRTLQLPQQESYLHPRETNPACTPNTNTERRRFRNTFPAMPSSLRRAV